jgi:hypothetical protein
MERIKAKIEDAKVYKIYDLFKKKPRGIGIGLTDAIVITAKPEKGEIIKETFYARLKADGTFTTSVLGHSVKGRQERLANFIKYYKLAKDPTCYNVRQEINKWIGKEVEIVPFEREGYIYIP